MEDDLIFFKWKTTSIFWKMEDNFKIRQMVDNFNILALILIHAIFGRGSNLMGREVTRIPGVKAQGVRTPISASEVENEYYYLLHITKVCTAVIIQYVSHINLERK